MRNFLFPVAVLLSIFNAAAEPVKINIVSSLGTNHMKSVHLLKQVELINSTQSTYQLSVEFKPGADGRLALRSADADPKNTIVGIGSYYVNHVVENKVNGNNYVYVEHSGHDMCTAVNTNVGDAGQGLASLSSLAGKTLVVGTVAAGAPDHLAALKLAQQYKFDVRLVIFKTPVDAFDNMAADHGVNMVFVGPPQYLKARANNPKLKILGISCDTRSSLVPDIKTVREQGFAFPRAFGFFLARKEMPVQWRTDVAQLFANAIAQLPKNPVLVYATDPNWFDQRVAEQQQFLKQPKQ